MIPILAQIVQRYLPGHKGALAKFRMRGIYAVDSTTIQLAYWCIKWAKHRLRKAAVKLHMVANVANMLPRFAVVGKASELHNDDIMESSKRKHSAGNGEHALAKTCDIRS